MNVYKAFFGWVAESFIDLPFDRAVRLVTCKRHDGNVWHTWEEGDMLGGNGGFSYVMYQTKSGKQLAHGITRATRQSIEKSHSEMLEVLKKEIENA